MTLSTREGKRYYYQLQAIDGNPVRSSRDMQSVLSRYQVGQQVTLQVRTPDRQKLDVVVTLSHFPGGTAFILLYSIPHRSGLSWHGGLGVCHPPSPFLRTGICTVYHSTALGIGLIFDVYTTHFLTPLWTIAIALIGGSVVSLVLLFPREDPIIQRRPVHAHIATLFGLVLAGYAVSRLMIFNNRLLMPLPGH